MECNYCGGMGYHSECCIRPRLVIPKGCRHCGSNHDQVPPCQWKEQVGYSYGSPIRSDFFSLQDEQEMCGQCKVFSVTENGMCYHCNEHVKKKNLGMNLECRNWGKKPPVFTGLCLACATPNLPYYEEGGPSHFPSSYGESTSNNYNNQNQFWQTLSPMESIGSCDWNVIPSDDE